MDLVPRVDGEMVDPDAVSVVELHQVVCLPLFSLIFLPLCMNLIWRDLIRPLIIIYECRIHSPDDITRILRLTLV